MTSPGRSPEQLRPPDCLCGWFSPGGEPALPWEVALSGDKLSFWDLGRSWGAADALPRTVRLPQRTVRAACPQRQSRDSPCHLRMPSSGHLCARSRPVTLAFVTILSACESRQRESRCFARYPYAVCDFSFILFSSDRCSNKHRLVCVASGPHPPVTHSSAGFRVSWGLKHRSPNLQEPRACQERCGQSRFGSHPREPAVS